MSKIHRRAVLAGLLLVGLVGVPTIARATSSPAGFVAPGSFGAVDFGDQVQYRLSASHCTRDAVRIEASGKGRTPVRGQASRPVRDPLDPTTCIGRATVPTERAVRQTGWDAGDPLDLALTAGTVRQPLRYQRIELEHSKPVAGTPTTVTPPTRDTRGGARDRAVQLDTGDVVSLGRVDLSRIYSISLRVCMVLPKPHLTPTFVELRATAPDGPTIVGPVDVNDDMVNDYKSNLGWPDCWQLQTWPITGKVPGRAPELFLTVTAGGGGPVLVSFMDVNGTGARVAEPPQADPPGTQTIFDGTSFKGWEQTDCALDEGGVRPVHGRDPSRYAAIATAGFVSEPGCSMTYTARKLHNVSIRFDYRMQDYGDNGGVFIGGSEIQMREAGEWLTGGLLGSSLPAALVGFAVDSEPSGYPAQRIKSNSYPDWSRMEITQVGSRFIVRVNGRTVTDCSTCAVDPGAFALRLATQPGFSYRYGVNGRFDSPFNPYVDDPANWGNLYFRNIRVYSCRSTVDPVCVGGPGVRG